MMHQFEVWAPRARDKVELWLEDGRHTMDAHGGGWWRLEAMAGPGTAYAFCLDGGDPRPDPRAPRMPGGPHEPGVVFDAAAFAWSDDAWPGIPLAGSVIYELHIGTFTDAGTFDAAIERLDHLVDLGIDVVEVMPVAAFPGVNGWGYDGVDLYAVHEPYGGPVGLQRFVDACHTRGLAVCLDVVYNHLGPDGNYLGEFGPYFTDRYGTPWGWALNLDGPQSDPVRAFLLDNVRQWLRDFHVDALRLDAVHELHDARALPVLEEMSQVVDRLEAELGRPLWLIAESDRNDPGTVTSPAAGGTGMDAQWADDIHHALHATFTGENQGYYADFAVPGALTKVLTTPFFHDGTWSSFRQRTHGQPVDREQMPGWRFVAALQTHDQVGNRMEGDRLAALLSPGELACAAAVLLTCAYTPMLFMGEEWAASTPWQYFTDHTDPELAEAVRRGRRAEFASHGWDRDDVPDPQDPATAQRSRLRWDEADQEPHARVLAWYRALLALRRSRPDLRDPLLSRVQVAHDVADGLLVVGRGEHQVVVNLSEGTRKVALDTSAATVLLLSWEATASLDEDGVVTLPARSVVVVGPSVSGR